MWRLANTGLAMLRGAVCAQLAGTVLVEMQRYTDGRSDSEELPMLPSLAQRRALLGGVLAGCQACHRRQSRVHQRQWHGAASF